MPICGWCLLLKAGQGSLLARRGWLVEGIALMEEGIADLQQAAELNKQKKAITMAWLAYAYVVQGQYNEAIELAQQSLSYYPEIDDYLTKVLPNSERIQLLLEINPN